MSDLDARTFVRRGNTLVAGDLAAAECLDGMKSGCEVLVLISRTRSPAHHRWFFALLRKVVDNNETWADEDDLLEDLKDAVGHVELDAINPLTKRVRRRTRSISFASMPEDKFSRFKERCLYVLAQKLGYDPIELMQDNERMVAQGTAWRGMARHGGARRGVARLGEARQGYE